MKSQFENLELNTEKTIPLVFEKKKNKSTIKTLKYINSDTGKIRHYPPAAQEWYNSIYTYNKNYVKSLPVLDKSLTTLLKSYCNMWPKQKVFKMKPKLLGKLIIQKKLKGKKIWALKDKNKINPIKFYKRLSPKKVFVGKGNLKHTSNKVIITLFTYNVQKWHLLKKIRTLINSFFLTKVPYLRTITYLFDKNKEKDNEVKWAKVAKKKKDRKGRDYPSKFIKVVSKENVMLKKVLLYNRRLTLNEYLNSSYNFFTIYKQDPYKPIGNDNPLKKLYPLSLLKKAERVSKIKNKDYFLPKSSYYNLLNYTLMKVNITTIRLLKILNYYKYLTILVQKKILNENEKLLIFISKASKFNVYKYRNTRFVFTKFKQKKIYLASLLRFAWLLYISDVKFKHPVLVSRLKYLVNNLYNKEVEFNLVELKKMHLSSDIYTQAVALKLKNRNNKLYRVLKSSLRKVNLPNVSRLTERYSEFNRDEYLANKIRNTYITSMFDYRSSKLDSLNNLLLGLFPSVYNLSKEIKEIYSTLKKSKKRVSLEEYVVTSLKYAKLAGIRVEAKGRLTRRFTAQRSVFKMRYKGGLKNVDSSFKGLSAVMVRGFVKSNVDYSIVHSKNRNGAYGVKGWVGSKDIE